MAERETIGDDLGRHAGPLAAVLFVEVLQHFFAPFVFEIDVDVRRFVALAADKPFEQHIHVLRIDRRDAQAVADGGIGGRTTSLAENAAAAGKPDQVPDRQEIGFVCQVPNQLQFVLDQLTNFVRNACGIPLVGPLPGEIAKVVMRSQPGRCQLAGIFVAQLIERKAAAIGDLARSPQGVRRCGVQLFKLLDAPQMPLGVGEPLGADFSNGFPCADGGQYIAQQHPLRDVVVHIPRGDQRQTRCAGQTLQRGQLPRIVGATMKFGQQVSAVGKDVAKIVQP